MSLEDQLRWVQGTRYERKRAGRAIAFGVVAAVCGCAMGWAGAGVPVAAAARDASASVEMHRAGTRKKSAALSPWEQAEQGRDALEAIPEGTRTRAEYTRAMDAYRAIYHADPADVHAAAAVNAVAELLAEQGQAQHDAKSLQAAVGQYEFLRTQYPASSLGVQALLAEGQIEQNDLNDAAAARVKYKLLLKEHARSEQAEEARAGLASLDEVRGARNKARGAGDVAGMNGSRAPGTRPVGRPEAGSETADSATGQPARPYPAMNDPSTRETGVSNRDQAATNGVASSVRQAKSTVSSLPAMAQTSGAEAPTHPTSPAKPATSPVRSAPAQGGVSGTLAGGEAHSGKPALVTGIRHWSTATYTRVAIDLGDNVTYEAARVPNPDRIYFDLHGTRLAPELVGKSFSVTDDGFLKRVRAAQYSDDVTRVVLDVNDVTEYSAFLLPNPYRLIIDIHGGTGDKEQGTGNGDREIADKQSETGRARGQRPRSFQPLVQQSR